MAPSRNKQRLNMNKGTSERPAEARRQQFALLVLVILTGLNLRPLSHRHRPAGPSH